MCALNLGLFCSRRVQELLLNTVVRVVVQCANLDPASKAAQELRRRAHRSHRLGKDLDQAAWICLDVHVAVKPGLQTIPFCLLAAELRPPMNSWICASLAFSRIPDTAKFRTQWHSHANCLISKARYWLLLRIHFTEFLMAFGRKYFFSLVSCGCFLGILVLVGFGTLFFGLFFGLRRLIRQWYNCWLWQTW